MKQQILLLRVLSLSLSLQIIPVFGQVGGQFTYKCGDTVYNCGKMVTAATMCVLGPRLKVVVGTTAQCSQMRTNLSTKGYPGVFTTKCPNGRLMTEYVQYNTQGKSGRKYDKNGSAKCLGARCGGDPHFLTYDGTSYSYHGQCDLVMASSKNLNGAGFDVDIHSRTKIIADWSYMSNVAIRIGTETLEITSAGEHYINGKADVPLPYKLMKHFNVSRIEKEVFPGQFRSDYVIDLEHTSNEDDGADAIRVSAFKDLLSVNVEAILPDTAGMLGIMGKDGMYGRDRKTEITDVNEMGQEWQVTDKEPMLFREITAPQYPEKCMLPQKKNKSVRNLRSEEDENAARRRAQEACDAIEDEDMKSFCIQDVLLSGDHEIAGLYHGH